MLWPFHSSGNLLVVVNVCLLVEALVLGFLVNLLYLCVDLHLAVFFVGKKDTCFYDSCLMASGYILLGRSLISIGMTVPTTPIEEEASKMGP